MAARRPPPTTAVQAEVDDAICRYRPRSNDPRWPLVRDHVVAWVTAARPAGPDSAVKLMTVTCALALWALAQGMPLDPETVLAPSTVARFVRVGLPGVEKASRGTYRSRLAQVGRAATKRAPWTAPSPIGRTPYRPPYTAVQIAEYLAADGTVRDARTARAFGAVLHLGAGAGAVPGEHLRVHARHVQECDDGTVEVLLAEGRRAERAVPVREPHAGALLRLAADHPAGPLAGAEPGLNALARLCEETVPDARLAPLSAGRLRNTWLVWLLGQPVPLGEVLRLAGLRSANNLGDLAARAVPLDARTAAAVRMTVSGRG